MHNCTLILLLPNISHKRAPHYTQTLSYTFTKEPMEALWNLEDKFKLSTQEALFLFVCTAFAVIGLCAATVLKKVARRKQLVDEGPDEVHTIRTNWTEQSCGWVSIKRMLMGSVRWSGARKWEERSTGSWRERPLQLLGLEVPGDEVGWQSHNSASPVWQRPILMGEKCELPRYSGLILYDERGRLLTDYHKQTSHKESTQSHKEKSAAVVRTTLKDLL